MTELEKPILLVGMMGAGKSRIGPPLAKKLGRRFFDSDKEVERIAGKTVAEIFEAFGEAGFRALEKGTIEGLLSHADVVIAGGGGVMPQPGAMNVWLRAKPEDLYRRVKDDKTRPKVSDITAFVDLFENRREGYSQAEIAVEARPDDVQKTVGDILKALGR